MLTDLKKVSWFVAVIALLIDQWVLSGAASDVLAKGVFLFFYLYVYMKIYCHYGMMITNYGVLYSLLDKFVFPVVLYVGVTFYFFGIYGFSDGYHVVSGLLLIFLLADINGSVRKVLMDSFIGRSWDDEKMGRGILFSSYPPKELLDMTGFHLLTVLILFFIFLL